RHCEEPLRRSNPCFRKWRDGLLRFARNDGCGRGCLTIRSETIRGSLGRAAITQIRHADAAGAERCGQFSSADIENETAIVAAQTEFDRLANFPPIRRLAV